MIVRFLLTYFVFTCCSTEHALAQEKPSIFKDEVELVTRDELEFFKSQILLQNLSTEEPSGQPRVLIDWLLQNEARRNQFETKSLEYLVISKKNAALEWEVTNDDIGLNEPMLVAARIPWENKHTVISFRLVALFRQQSKPDELVIVERQFSNKDGAWREIPESSSKVATPSRAGAKS